MNHAPGGLILCLLIAGTGLVVGACGPATAQATGCPAPDVGNRATAVRGIAFTRDSQIYLVNPDGTGLRALTGDGYSYNDQPAWSRDGTRIALSRSRSDVKEVPQIYVMAADGQGMRRLTCDNKYEDSPTWSPDGKQIAYSRAEPDGRDSIVSMAADGTNATVIARYVSFEDASVAWAPDGRHIAYCTKTGIVVINPDGTGSLQLTRSTSDFTVSWSPDSKWIAFTRGVGDTSVSQIWIVSATGGVPRRITSSGSYGSPTWSPDGSRLAFSSQPDKPARIYVSRSDGSQLHAITPSLDGQLSQVAWSPA